MRTGKGQMRLSVSQTMLLRASGHGALQRQGQDREQAGTRQELGLCLQVHPRQHPPAPGTGTLRGHEPGQELPRRVSSPVRSMGVTGRGAAAQGDLLKFRK